MQRIYKRKRVVGFLSYGAIISQNCHRWYNFSLVGKKVVTVGGGSGSPDLNRALLRTGRVDFITAVAAVFDSGGATGMRRLNSEGKEPAFSDAMRILLSLVNPGDLDGKFEVINKWFSDRDARGRVLGQEIFHRFFNPETGYLQIIADLKKLGIGFSGTVVPSTTHSANILFTTASGRKYQGEHMLDIKSMSQDMVIDMELVPPVPAFALAREAIAKARVIFLSYGSVHGSVLCNFLPDGMRQAISHSPAKIYLVTNLVSSRNETHNFSPQDYIRVVRKYIGRPVDAIIVPAISRREFESKYPNVAALYKLEHSHFLGWEADELNRVTKEGVKVITHRATKVVAVPDKGTTIVRHDSIRLAETLAEIW